ncbi:hypothetical protein N1851_034235 [Merluccius polli]|uniref:Integrase zinc-binding domain-containing protein n=1 Tax=Merluccius polli TaxID=89951 RepID=A0AA47LZY7_MERPO|nr:hypothetical protein N1851_034235 [Merluccius polli]
MVVLTEKEKDEVLTEVHAGHFGAKRMQDKINQRFYWKTITRDAQDWAIRAGYSTTRRIDPKMTEISEKENEPQNRDPYRGHVAAPTQPESKGCEGPCGQSDVTPADTPFHKGPCGGFLPDPIFANYTDAAVRNKMENCGLEELLVPEVRKYRHLYISSLKDHRGSQRANNSWPEISKNQHISSTDEVLGSIPGPAFIQINMREQIQGLAILLKDAYR